MSSRSKTPRPFSRVLGSPNKCRECIIKRDFHPRGLSILWRCRALRRGGLAGGEKGMTPGNPPERR